MLIINTGKNIGKLVSSVITSSQSVDLNDPEKREQIGWKTEKSCHDILLAQPKSSSGKYVIGVGNTFEEVYCDMKTDG